MNTRRKRREEWREGNSVWFLYDYCAYYTSLIYSFPLLYLFCSVTSHPVTSHHALCCPVGEMSKQHAFKEDIKLRIAEVRDEVMKEPTLSISDKKEVLAYPHIFISLFPAFIFTANSPVISLC